MFINTKKLHFPVFFLSFSLLLNFLLFGSLIIPIGVVEVTGSENWVSDNGSLDGWLQCKGDSVYDASIASEDARYSFEYYVMNYSNTFTPEERSNSTKYWSDASIGDNYHFAGIYRQIDSLKNNSYWKTNLTVSFDAGYQNGYSFCGELAITIDNEDKEPMLRVKIRDPSSNSGNHGIWGIVDYWDTSDVEHRHITTEKNSTDYVINSGNFALRKNGTKLFVLFPEEIPGDIGWREIGDTSILLQRGTPTYLRLHFNRWYVRPLENRIEKIQFEASNDYVENNEPTNLDDWVQCVGVPEYESGIAEEDPRCSYEYDVINYSNAFTPEDKQNSTGYWNDTSIGDYYHYAGVYRNLSSFNNNLYWLANLTVSFDAMFENGFSFCGDLAITIDNENKESMLRIKIRDPSSNAGAHRVRGIVDYWDDTGSEIRHLTTVVNSLDSDIDSENFALMKKDSKMYVLFPHEIPGALGWREIGETSTFLQRGTPTYVRLHFSRWYMRPLENRIENIEFKHSNTTDITTPIISSQADKEFEYNNLTNKNIEWTVAESNPGWFTITLNNSLVDEGLWNGVAITVDLELLDLGVHAYSLHVMDLYGNTAISSILVKVVDTNSPLVSSISHVDMTEDDTFTITWEIQEPYPSEYYIVLDGTEVESKESYGSTISLLLENLLTGSYNYTLVVYDSSGNQASASIIVTILESTIIPDSSSSTTPTTTTDSTESVTNSLPEITSGFEVTILLFSILLVYKRTKKKTD